MSQIQLNLEKLDEIEDKAKSTIQAIQQEIDESAKEMVTQNAEHQKRKQELEEKHQKEMAELESKNWEKNAKFAKEMTSLKERLKEKIDWNQVDLAMGKKLVANPIVNPKANVWKAILKNNIAISADGLNATINMRLTRKWQSVSAEQGFIISADFPGPVLYYFEVTIMSEYKWPICVGLSNGNIADGSYIGGLLNCYGIQGGHDDYFLSGKSYPFDWPNGAIKPKWKGQGDVLGCGILLFLKNKLSIFFTANGILLGKQIPITSTLDPLYPSVTMYEDSSVQANFGDDSVKPFKYDINKCPGMVFK